MYYNLYGKNQEGGTINITFEVAPAVVVIPNSFLKVDSGTYIPFNTYAHTLSNVLFDPYEPPTDFNVVFYTIEYFFTRNPSTGQWSVSYQYASPLFQPS